MTEDDGTYGASWATPFESFNGGAAEMAEALSAAMAQFDWSASDPEPSARLIRHYTQEGALDRPERRGKEAIYQFRQLVQYVALRWLLHDGWPLAKAAVETSSRRTDELIALPPLGGTGRRPDQPDAASLRATALVASFIADASKSASVPTRQLGLSARAGRYSRARSAARATAETPTPRETLRIDLADWCAVVIDRDALDAMEDTQAHALGDALREALVDAKLRRSHRKKR